ncbi:MAG: hypothetical protein AAFW81_00215 [Pseudomonadota bacterium]
MTRWIENRLQRSSWLGFLIWFAGLMGYSFWAFMADTPWTRALEAAGGKLPEMQPNFPGDEPAQSISALREAGAIPDYLMWQVLDFPYAALNLLATATAMALGLRALKLGAGPARYLLLLPLLYFAAETIENALLALYAGAGVGGALTGVQQGATAVKFAAGNASLLLGLVALIIAAVVAAVSFFKRRGAG